MENTAITPLEKYAEYGNPSGHVWLGYVWVTYVFETFFYCHKLWMNEETCRYGNHLNSKVKEGEEETKMGEEECNPEQEKKDGKAEHTEHNCCG